MHRVLVRTEPDYSALFEAGFPLAVLEAEEQLAMEVLSVVELPRAGPAASLFYSGCEQVILLVPPPVVRAFPGAFVAHSVSAQSPRCATDSNR